MSRRGYAGVVHRSVVALSLAFALFAFAPGASALQCREDFQKVAFGGADVVVVATATSVPAADDSGVRRVRLKVERSLKGTAVSEVDVDVAGFKGGFAFLKGRRYLVFASRDAAGSLWVHDCGGTVAMEHAAEALALVEAARAKAPPHPSGAPSEAPPPVPPEAPPAVPPEMPPAVSAAPLAATSAPNSPSAAPPTSPSTPPPRGGCASCTATGADSSAPFGAQPAWALAALWAARRRRRAPAP